MIKLLGSISRATDQHYTQYAAHDYLAGAGNQTCYVLVGGKIVHAPQIVHRGHVSPDFSTQPFDLISTDDNDALWLNEHLLGTSRAQQQVKTVGDEENCLGTPQHYPEPQITDFIGNMPIQPNFVPADLRENRRSPLPPLFDRTGPRRFGATQVTLKSSYQYDILKSVDPIPEAQGLFPDMTSHSASGRESFTFQFTLCRIQRERCDP